jgi:hypothetical protein
VQFRVLYVVLWGKIYHSPNYKQLKMAKNPVSWWSLKIELLKRTLLTWKPIHSLTPEYWMFMEISHTVGLLVCVTACVISKYFKFLCLLNALFQIMQVSNASRKSLILVWLNVAFPSSGVTTCQVKKCIAFSEYVQPMFKDLETCMHVHHWLATNGFNYSVGFMNRLWWISGYFFIGLKVVVYLPSKDIVGNEVTSCIFLSWMIILRDVSVRTFAQPWDFSYCV